ncbi:alpha-amylase [Clostridium sp.]|uniref:alpha-amylase n=1 Tax=Clostridium sp. TaxID=1506 RepID=UPI003F33A9B9
MINDKFFNGTMMQYFHWYLPSNCGLWNKVSRDATYLSHIGITSLWLPPAYKGNEGINDVGYTVYDLYDLGEFNQKGSVRTKYGTKDEYLNAINSLHKNNVQAYADISFEHKIGADQCEPVKAIEFSSYNNFLRRSEPIDILAWTKFTFPGRSNKYSSFKWDWTCFDSVDCDQGSCRLSLFKFLDKAHTSSISNPQDNSNYLIGAHVDLNNTHVRSELINWGDWYLNFTGIDGFRLDAVKHVNNNFLKDWVETLRYKSGKELFSVGEYWHPDINVLTNYISSTNGKISLFDVPLHFNFQKAASSNGEYDMRNILKGTLMESSPINAVTFIDNHDTQKGQALESYVLNWFKPLAYSIILLRAEGYPCVFYADYYGDGLKGSIPPMNDILDKLLLTRKNKAYGQQNDYFDHEDIIGWTREGNEDHNDSGLAAILSNGSEGFKDMYVGKQFAGDFFYDILGNKKELVKIDNEGIGRFTVNSSSVSVWVKNDDKLSKFLKMILE